MFDEYVEHGLLKATLRCLCRAPGREEVPSREVYKAVVFHDFFEVGYDSPVRILLMRYCNISSYRSIS